MQLYQIYHTIHSTMWLSFSKCWLSGDFWTFAPIFLSFISDKIFGVCYLCSFAQKLYLGPRWLQNIYCWLGLFWWPVEGDELTTSIKTNIWTQGKIYQKFIKNINKKIQYIDAPFLANMWLEYLNSCLSVRTGIIRFGSKLSKN